MICPYARELIVKTKNGEYVPLSVGCDQCVVCEKNRAYSWYVRILSELRYCPEACVLTLTYDDEHLPKDGRLNKRDFQLFLKRLRKHVKTPLRFFLCGEYGSETERAHGHAIVLGWKPNDMVFWKRSKKGTMLYNSKIACKIWKNGFVQVGEVSDKAIPYCCKYLNKVKPISWEKKKEEFLLMSRMPAIGAFTDEELERGYLWWKGNKLYIPNSVYENEERYERIFPLVHAKRRDYAESLSDQAVERQLKKSLYIQRIFVHDNQRRSGPSDTYE